MRWVHKDGGVFYVDENELFGFRTQAEIVRCANWGSRNTFFLLKTKHLPKAVSYPDAETAMKAAEAIVALNYQPQEPLKTATRLYRNKFPWGA